MDLKLTNLLIQGFKSFGGEQQIRFGDITIFIGANGSGKSNLMSFFEMLEWMMDKKLANYVATHGKASSFAHLSNTEANITGALMLKNENGGIQYFFVLSPTIENTFIVSVESIQRFTRSGEPLGKQYYANGSREESRLDKLQTLNESKTKLDANPAAEFLKEVKSIRSYDFSNTDDRFSPLRKESYKNNVDGLFKRGDNISSYLYGLSQSTEFKKYYDRIVRNIRLAYPSFDDFVLAPGQFDPDNIRLDWRDKNCPPGFRFGPHQLSDGTLRFVALSTLLLQPPETIPKVIVIDEPELGLHPTALSILSNMIYTASKYSQVVIATQSAQLLDYFGPENIRVVEREGSNSIVREPDKEQLDYWLENYSLGQIWEKNIIGGRP